MSDWENTSTVASTNATSESNMETYRILWAVGLTLTCLVATFNVWVAIAFIKFAKTTSILKKKSRSDVDGGLIFKAAIAAVMLPLFRFSTSLLIYAIGSDPTAHQSCLVVIYVNNVFFAIPILAVYLFLWIRQRAFYKHPSIGRLFNRCVSAFSKASLALLILPLVVSLIVEIAINRYKSSDIGCVFENNQDHIKFRFYIYAIVLVSGQAILLSLFIHPLYVHSKSQKSVGDSSDSGNTRTNQTVEWSAELESRPKSQLYERNQPINEERCESARGLPDDVRSTKAITRDGARGNRFTKHGNGKRESLVYHLIRRTFFLASTSILSDMIAMGVCAFLLSSHAPYLIMCMLLDFDSTVNIISVLGSFKNWREIMCGRRRFKI